MNKQKTAVSDDPQDQQANLLTTLKDRFEHHMERHPDGKWTAVENALRAHLHVLATLQKMEDTGGEPDVVVLDEATDKITFVDCSPESPSGRRSLCYDQQALNTRKEHKPKDTALDMAARMGITLLTEDEYRKLQTLGEFDTKTSSWIQTPNPVRKRGGALFCDRRYDHVFTYHNGADSYYAARGFRGLLLI